MLLAFAYTAYATGQPCMFQLLCDGTPQPPWESRSVGEKASDSQIFDQEDKFFIFIVAMGVWFSGLL